MGVPDALRVIPGAPGFFRQSQPGQIPNRLALSDIHTRLGADFAGFDGPAGPFSKRPGASNHVQPDMRR